MKVTEILKAYGVFSKDIRIRLKNGQLRLNNNIIKEDFEITTFELCDEPGNEVKLSDFVEDAGDFIFHNIAKNPIWLNRCILMDFQELFDTDIENDLTLFLKGFNLLKISKREMIVIKKF